jgi:hypothetical protein
MQGLSQWKSPEGDFTPLDLQSALQESVEILFQPPGEDVEDEKYKIKSNPGADVQESPALPLKPVSELWKTAQMARARLVVVMAPRW